MEEKKTAHINPKGKEIAETVLLPGDPLRAKFIAETYLSDLVQFNTVRNALGYTGMYKNKKISVLGTGMGMPSFGIYAWELIHVFGVKNLIRIGSCGALSEKLNLFDIVVATSSSFESNIIHNMFKNINGNISLTPSWDMLRALDKLNAPVIYGDIFTTDIFYRDDLEVLMKWKDTGVLGVDMETAMLYAVGRKFDVNVLSILSVSDHILSQQETTAQERETGFTDMMELSLDLFNAS